MATRDPDFPLVAHFTMPHIRVQASGTLGNGQANESWTMGFKVIATASGTPGVPEIPNQQDVQDAADAGLAAFSGLIVAQSVNVAGALVSSDVELTEVKSYAVGPDNHADITLQTVNVFPSGGPPVIGKWDPSTGGSSVAGRLPYSVAVCVTLRGDSFRKGVGALGRFYIPGANIFAGGGGAAAPLVHGLMDPGTVGAFATAGAAFVNTFNQHAFTGPLNKKMANVGVVTLDQSRVRWQPVSQVIVDSRPDTVRRRSNKIGGRGKVIIATTS